MDSDTYDQCVRFERAVDAAADEVTSASRELIESYCVASDVVQRAVWAARDFSDEIATIQKGWSNER